jgi:predicted Fe-Mo cluster-binding NifX family protein
MKIAIPIWNERISPVFDVAQRLLLLKIENGYMGAREEKDLDSTPMARVRLLSDAAVDVLICGAISGPLAMQIRQNGTEVICDICGAVSEVIDAYIKGNLESNHFIMPGCCRRRRGFQMCRRQGRNNLMNEEKMK